jgi:hypothetical protein
VASARWDTNLNHTLGTASDAYAVNYTSTFSYGINDWGLSVNASPQLGLGGDVDGAMFRGPVTDTDVVAPSRMIMLGDTAPRSPPLWEANLDPAQNTQWPSNRHHYLTDFVFTDGHAETPLRNDVISPVADNLWRNRWNNDNKPHNEISWTVSADADQLDPSY